ncbi:MAG: FAD-dependent oxidoreductase [Actinomycetaceae bacterium]|nr:FAD-dependent oxidoreductase [Actinomycetaceae bacterium]
MFDVIVVGAGISGLTAAWTLQRAGAKVAVLEGSHRVGGRVHTREFNDCVMEAGANFVTDAYCIIPELAEQPGLEDALIAQDESAAVVRIPHAMPASPPVRIGRIAAYRRHAEGRRIILAGDSIGWPWTDSAAFTGRWAADLVVGRQR